MAVPKKRVSRTRKLLRYSNWKKEIVSQALHALSQAKSSRRPNTNFRFAGSKPSLGDTDSNDGKDGPTVVSIVSESARETPIINGDSSLPTSEAGNQVPPSSI